MRQFADILAKTVSVLLYPLFIPTYGIALFAYAFNRQVQALPAVYWIILICGTFIFTCLLPLSSILVMIRKGTVRDIQIENAKERKMPYIYSIVSFCFWCYFLISVVHTPLYINVVGIGATVAITLVAFINRWWKISAHLTGLGGLLGGIFSFYLGVGTTASIAMLCVWTALTVILMASRLWLNAHTPAQVICGWLLGLICTFIPNAIISYVQ